MRGIRSFIIFTRINLFVFICLFMCLSTAFAADERVALTSDTMKYDIEAGRFIAEGNVTLNGRGLTIVAARGEGYVDKQMFNISGNVSITGTWQGDKVNLTAESAAASISEPATFTFKNGIKGSIGDVTIDCDFLEMIGDDLSAKALRRLYDAKAGIELTADTAKAKMAKGELMQVDANGNITIKGKPGKNEDTVEIYGKKALYSLERGTVVISGGVSAIQKKRTLNAETIVYFPKTNRIEALGTPRITINVEDEKLDNKKPTPKPAPSKTKKRK